MYSKRMITTINNNNCSNPVFINMDIDLTTSACFVAQSMPRRAMARRLRVHKLTLLPA